MNVIELFTNNFDGHIAMGVSLIFIFFLGFLAHLIKTKHLHRFSTSLLITTGIFFTFLGISFGLANFDVNDIDKSLPMLINGIKTAFLVSVFGVAGAIVLKLLSIVFELKVKNSQTLADEYSIADIITSQNQMINELKSTNMALTNLCDIQSEYQKNQAQMQKEQLESNSKLLKAVSGDEDSSLIGQIKNLRMDINDRFAELVREFKTFAHTMAENSSKVLIEALRDVIKDFNDKITEQFGENFKQLNEAVGKLLQWQENYKIYIEQSQSALKTIQEAIQAQSDDYKKLVDATNDFVNGAKGIFEVVENIKDQRELLEYNTHALARHLDSLKENLPNIINEVNNFRQESIKAFNDIVKQSADLREHYENCNTAMAQSLSEHLNQIKNNIQSYNETINNQISTNLNKSSQILDTHFEKLSQKSQEIQSNYENSAKALVEGFNNHLNNLDKELNSYNERLNTQLIEALNKASHGINSQVEMFDKEMENALKNVSNNIVSISGRFIDDYRQISSSLSEATKNLLSAVQGSRR